MDTAEQLERQLPHLMRAWETALRSGYSVRQCVEATAQMTRTQQPLDMTAEYSSLDIMEAMPIADAEPLRGAFAQVLADWQAGGDFFAALDGLRGRYPSPGLDLLVTALRVQREVGGNLADLLEATGLVLQKRLA